MKVSSDAVPIERFTDTEVQCVATSVDFSHVRRLPSTLHPVDTCGGPLEDLSSEVAGYIPPGRQVVLADALHEFTGCGQISHWSMIFSCSASSDGNGYPIELQVFRQNGASRNYRLVSRAQVTLQDEQCESQLVTFNVSLPFSQRNHVGMYVPNLAGLTGLGYRESGNSQDAYLDKEFSVPPSVGDRISFANSDFEYEALPLVSMEGRLVTKITLCSAVSSDYIQLC